MIAELDAHTAETPGERVIGRGPADPSLDEVGVALGPPDKQARDVKSVPSPMLLSRRPGMIRSTEQRDQMGRQSRAFKLISELNKKHRGDRKAILKDLMERSGHADASLQPEITTDS